MYDIGPSGPADLGPGRVRFRPYLGLLTLREGVGHFPEEKKPTQSLPPPRVGHSRTYLFLTLGGRGVTFKILKPLTHSNHGMPGFLNPDLTQKPNTHKTKIIRSTINEI
jgi:hypothetical protein